MSTIEWSFYAFIVSRKLDVERLEAWSSVFVSRVKERLGIQKRFFTITSSPVLTLFPQIWITKSPKRCIIGSHPCEQTDFSRLYHKDRLHSKWNRSYWFLEFFFFFNSIVCFHSKLFKEVLSMRFFDYFLFPFLISSDRFQFSLKQASRSIQIHRLVFIPWYLAEIPIRTKIYERLIYDQ